MDMPSISPISIVPVRTEQQAIDAVKVIANIVSRLRTDVLVPDMDYGVIPGTGAKPTLLLPGMEKLMRALNAVPEYIERCVIRDYDRPLFHYEYECRLLDADSGLPIPGGRGLGMCTSHESAFRWRKTERLCPKCGKPTIIKGKAEYGGGWICFDKKGGCKAKFADGDKSIEDQAQGRIENPDIFDQVNAILKRAKKRALGDAVKGAANVSEFFTVDLEDMVYHADVVDGEFRELDEAPKPNPKPAAPPAQSKPAASAPASAEHTEPDAPAETTKPGTWPTADDINYVVNYCVGKLAITLADMARYLNMDDLSVIDNWRKYENGGAAMKAVKAAMDAEAEALKQMPPAAPKGENPFTKRHNWTPGEIQDMDNLCATFWNTSMDCLLLPDVFLAESENIAWTGFPNGPMAAKAALIQYVSEHNLPIVVKSAVFSTDGKHTTFSNGLLEVVMYSRDMLRALDSDWKAYVDSWQKGSSYIFDRKGLPELIVSWEAKTAKAGHEYLQCTAVRQLVDTPAVTEDVPF